MANWSHRPLVWGYPRPGTAPRSDDPSALVWSDAFAHTGAPYALAYTSDDK